VFIVVVNKNKKIRNDVNALTKGDENHEITILPIVFQLSLFNPHATIPAPKRAPITV
jgi:hypothetical protein